MCGLRSLDGAREALGAGAQWLGFVLAPGYRRTVAPGEAREIVAALGRGRVRYVGVFVDPDPEEAGRLARWAGLDLVQLSGRESPEDVRAVGLPALKAVHVRRDEDPTPQVERYAAVAELVLLDSYSRGAAGGTGERFPWALAARAARDFPVMLAGGLTPGNVAEAIAAVGPHAVDVSSGVETDGEKDPEKIAAFARAVREAGRC